MTVFYTNADVKKGQLTIGSIGTENYQVDLTGGSPVTVSIGSNVKGDGLINLGSGNDTIQNNGHGNVVANLGAGNDTFVQRTGGTHIDITGGLGNDILYNIGGGNSGGATANYNYLFNNQIASQDGHDGINGFVLGRDTLSLHGTAGIVNAGNFSNFFTVTDAPGSAGDVITDHNNDGWSVQLIGVHLTAQQLVDGGAFLFVV
jgi:hypothetical protein